MPLTQQPPIPTPLTDAAEFYPDYPLAVKCVFAAVARQIEEGFVLQRDEAISNLIRACTAESKLLAATVRLHNETARLDWILAASDDDLNRLAGWTRANIDAEIVRRG